LRLTGGAMLLPLVAACAPIQSGPAAKPTEAPAGPTPAPAKPTAAAPTSAPATGATPAGGPAEAAKPTAAPPKPTAVTARKGGTIALAINTDVNNLDPFLGAGNHGYMLARGVFNTLTQYDEKLEPRPELAESWQLSADGRELTMSLRRGVKFHSGREFLADDVLFSLQAAQDARYAALNRNLATPLKAETRDRHTVVFSTEKPYAAIFDALDGLFIVDKDTAEPRFPDKAVGTGPFAVGQRVPNDYTRFERFDDYWSGPANLDRFELRPMPDITARAVNLESGAIDAAWQLNYPDYVRLRDSGRYQASTGAEGAIYYDLTINTTVPVFEDKRVRQALNWALDRKRFVDIVLRNVVEPTSVPYPEASLAYDADLADTFNKDLDRARGLIGEAGQAGFSATILTSTRRNPGMIDLAQILQADLKTIGVDLKIDDVEPAAYDQRYQSSQFDVAVHTFGRANKDPATLFGGAIAWYTDPNRNPSKFNSERYRQLVDEGATTVDRAKRKAIYREITLLLQDECFTIPVAEQPRVWVLQPHVKDFVYSPDNMPLWHRAWVDR
jgi:peptide/nickel transport system substrate-binding protein